MSGSHSAQSIAEAVGRTHNDYAAFHLGSYLVLFGTSLRVVSTASNALNRPTSVASNGKTYVSNVAYWPHGAVYSYQRHNALSYGTTCNSRLQLAEVDEATPATPTNSFLWVSCPDWGLNNGGGSTYGLCPQIIRSLQNNGNLLAVTAYTPSGSTAAAFSALQGIQQTFTYDGLNRIASVTDNGGGSSASRTFGYDAYGNMWIPANNGLPIGANPAPPTMQSAYNASNNQLFGATYDSSGNQQTFGTHTLAYDAESRQVSETTSGGGVPATHLYDGDGRRVQTTGGSVHTYYVYDAAGNLSAEYSDTTNSSTCQTCYLSYDHLGSTRMVTDESAQVVDRHDYLPFGEEIINGYAGRGTLWGMTRGSVNQKFTGRERDQESGLDYFGPRYYGSALGRFTSPDPLSGHPDDPQSWNAAVSAIPLVPAELPSLLGPAEGRVFWSTAHGGGKCGSICFPKLRHHARSNRYRPCNNDPRHRRLPNTGSSTAFASGAQGSTMVFAQGASATSFFITRELPALVFNDVPIVLGK